MLSPFPPRDCREKPREALSAPTGTERMFDSCDGDTLGARIMRE